MPYLRVLDVIVIPDGTITPPGPKLVVCIHPGEGWFYRINTKRHWRPSVVLKRDPDHLFLEYDSHLECGDPLEVDDYIIEEALRRIGVVGRISNKLCPAIISALRLARYLKETDKAAIIEALTSYQG